MKTSPKEAISPTEVEQWFGPSPQAKLEPSQHEAIAARLMSFHWDGDPPTRRDLQEPKSASEPDDRWWDFKSVLTAAKTLRDNMSKMASFQQGLQWSPLTRDGYDAIKTLDTALSAAMPYIEWPFGHYERATGRKESKEWHTLAVVIARVVIDEMVNAGHNPGIARNSVVVRIVSKSLARMQVPGTNGLTTGAISAHLTRSNEKYGLTPNGIAALTTK